MTWEVAGPDPDDFPDEDYQGWVAACEREMEWAKWVEAALGLEGVDYSKALEWATRAGEGNRARC